MTENEVLDEFRAAGALLQARLLAKNVRLPGSEADRKTLPRFGAEN